MTAPLLDDAAIDMEMPATLTPTRLSDDKLIDQIYAMSWFDQWEREWVGSAHMKHGHPIGQVRLHPRYLVPYEYLIPPQQFLLFDGRRGSTRVTVKLLEWQQATAAAQGIYDRRLMEIARKLYKDRAAEEAASGNPDLLNLVGAPPLHGKFLAAMAKGNRWALGIVNPQTGQLDPTPAWAVPLLDTLRKRETFAGSATVTEYDDDFSNPDGETWAGPRSRGNRRAARRPARFEAIEDEFDPPTPPAPVRGKGGQFQKRHPS